MPPPVTVSKEDHDRARAFSTATRKLYDETSSEIDYELCPEKKEAVRQRSRDVENGQLLHKLRKVFKASWSAVKSCSHMDTDLERFNNCPKPVPLGLEDRAQYLKSVVQVSVSTIPDIRTKC